MMNRRKFFTGVGAVSVMGASGFLPRFIETAHAKPVDDYKALVCLFLQGGMDHADTIIPYEKTSYEQLHSLRKGLFNAYGVGSGKSSRDRENLMPLPNYGHLALPPQLKPLHRLFANGDAAIIGNVGPLVQPTTREEIVKETAVLPKRLFSHNDQRATWMSPGGVEGSQIGWGGKFADYDLSKNSNTNKSFAAVRTIGNDVFLYGDTARPFSASIWGVENINLISGEAYADKYSDEVKNLLKSHFSSSQYQSSNIYNNDMAFFNKRAHENMGVYAKAMSGIDEPHVECPPFHLGLQLHTVAKIIAARRGLGINRQVFYVSLSGFDTHSYQTNKMLDLHRQLGVAIEAFFENMKAAGMADKVTLFTASDFGRTLVGNGDGTDHGWGGHQFVVGGAVKGGKIYGDIPEPDISLGNYTTSKGRLIPDVSVAQYAATLGKWFGLPSREIDKIFPHLKNFETRDLGFLV